MLQETSEGSGEVVTAPKKKRGAVFVVTRIQGGATAIRFCHLRASRPLREPYAAFLYEYLVRAGFSPLKPGESRKVRIVI